MILPAALRYQTELATNVAALTAAGVAADTALLLAVSAPIGALKAGLAELEEASHGRHDHTGIEEATYARDHVLPAMAAVRGRGRQAGGPGGRRPVVAPDVPGDALHPVTAQISSGTIRIAPAGHSSAHRPQPLQ